MDFYFKNFAYIRKKQYFCSPLRFTLYLHKMAQQRYQTQFDSYDGLQTVVCAIENFSPDRFLAALQQKNKMSLDYLVALDSQVLDAISHLQEQKYDLLNFSQEFNNQFVTRRNHCFSSAHQLLHKIHSGATQAKRIFTRFTPNSSAAVPSHTPATYTKPSIYERSPLGTEAYMPSLWPIETYPEEVQQLFHDLKRFFALLHDALILCVNVMRKEESIRRDAQQCCALYRSFKDDNYHRVKRILKSINIYTDQFSPFLNPAIDLRQSSASEEEFSQKGFHSLDYEDVCTLTVMELVEEEQRGEFTKEELNLFAENRPLIRRLHTIIANFDSYLDVNVANRKKLPAKYIACLLLWAQPKEEKAFVEYFAHTYQGQHSVPDNTTVNVQKNKIRNGDKLYEPLKALWNEIKG